MSRDSSAREALTTSSSAPRSSSSQGVDRSVRLHAIHVRIVGARSLSSNPVDALCMLWCGNQSEAVKTATKRRTADPVWEENFSLAVQEDDEALYLAVWDRGRSFLGRVVVPLQALHEQSGSVKQGTCVLEKDEENHPSVVPCGTLSFEVTPQYMMAGEVEKSPQLGPRKQTSPGGVTRQKTTILKRLKASVSRSSIDGTSGGGGGGGDSGRRPSVSISSPAASPSNSANNISGGLVGSPLVATSVPSFGSPPSADSVSKGSQRKWRKRAEVVLNTHHDDGVLTQRRLQDTQGELYLMGVFAEEVQEDLVRSVTLADLGVMGGAASFGGGTSPTSTIGNMMQQLQFPFQIPSNVTSVTVSENFITFVTSFGEIYSSSSPAARTSRVDGSHARYLGPAKKHPMHPMWDSAKKVLMESLMNISTQVRFEFERLDVTKGDGTVSRVGVGSFHSVASTIEGPVMTWGDNLLRFRDAGVVCVDEPATVAGQLGIGSTMSASPTQVQGLPTDAVMDDVAAGLNHTVVAGHLGVYSSGSNAFGQLGREGDSLTFGLVSSGIREVVSLACGDQHTVVVTSEGLVFSWGSNLRGQLGIGPQLVRAATPMRVPDLVGSRVGCGAFHTLACSLDGALWAWGSNHFGQLGVGAPTSNLFRPCLVSIPGVSDICDVSCGPDSSLAISASGVAYVWGMLMSADGAAHEYRPRRLDQIFNSNLYISRAAMGKLQLAFIADTTFTKLLTSCVKSMAGRLDAPLAQLKRNMLMMPLHSLGIQNRAMQWLAESSERYLPCFLLDKCSFRVVPEFKEEGRPSVTTRVITLHNTSDFPIDVRLNMPSTERFQTSRVTLAGDPDFCTVDRNARQPISFTITCSAPPLEDVVALFFLEARPKPKKGVVGVGSSSSSSSSSASSSLSSSSSSSTTSGANLNVTRFWILITVSHECKTTSTRNNNNRVTVSLSGSGSVGTISGGGGDDTADMREQSKVDEAITYVPKIIRHHLEIDPRPLTTPTDALFQGVILMLDISGFTLLNERLSKLGPGGPEQVSFHLNKYFGQLIEVVEKAGGDVLKFAGDALICMFGGSAAAKEPEDDEPATPLADLALKAVRCGLLIQSELPEYDSQAGFTLTLHVGVGVGALHAVQVGGVDGAWEFLVVGEPFLQLPSVVEQSQTGEVVVSPQTWALISSQCEGDPRPTPGQEPNVRVRSVVMDPPLLKARNTNASSKWVSVRKVRGDREMMPALRCFLPPGVLSKLDAMQIGWTAELRRVTVLFCKLRDYTYEPSKPLDVNWLHETLRLMQQLVFRTEGTVRQFLVDDKGAVLIAVFGMPPFPHEDDEIRGVRVALEMHNMLQQRDIRNSVGVTSGEVFCGSVGSKNRQEYAVVGDVVNLSARLMIAAEKLGLGILCDEQTAKNAAGVQFTAHEAIHVKGKEQLVAIFSPEGVKSEQSSQGVLRAKDWRGKEKVRILGRNFEKQALSDALDALVQKGEPHSVVISGPPGIGKKVLASYALQSLPRDGSVTVLRGSCTALDKSTPFYVWRFIVAQLIENVEEGNRVTLAHWTQQELGEDWVSSLGLLKDLVPALGTLNPVTRKLTRKQRLSQLGLLVRGLLERWTLRHKTVILIENVQWLDDESARMTLEMAAEFTSNVFCLFTSRPVSDASLHLQQLFQLVEDRKFFMRLGTMSQSDLEAMVCANLEVDSLPPVLCEYIASKCEGTPLFALEVCSDLVAKGHVAVLDNGEVQVKRDLKTLNEIPEAVQQVLSARLDQLGPSTQMVVKVASVIGHIFTKSLLVAVFPVREDVHAMDLHLFRLVKLGLIREMSEDSFQFRSALFRATAYARLLFEQRLRLHGGVATELAWADTKANAEAIANHWFMAVCNNHMATAQLVTKALELLFAGVSTSTEAVAQSNLEKMEMLLDSKESNLSVETRTMWRKVVSQLAGKMGK